MIRYVRPLERSGITILPGNEGKVIFPERISLADILIIQRSFPNYPAYDQVMSLARAQDKAVIYEIDDLLFELPDQHIERAVYDEAVFPMMQAILEADAVTTSTHYLREWLASFNVNTWLLPNYLDDRSWQFRTLPQLPNEFTSDGKPIVIGFMGGDTHQSDLELVAPVLLRLLRRYGMQIIFRFWGCSPPLELQGEPNVEATSLNIVSYAEFAAYFSHQQSDLFIAPLGDNLFNRCKSHIKFLEYSVLGVPGVYSNLPPYQGIVIHGENGFLASSPDEWETYLIRLIESKSLRGQIGLRAQETVQKNWLISGHAHEWEQAFQEILQSVGKTQKSAVARRVAAQLPDLKLRSQRALIQKVAAIDNRLAEKDLVLRDAISEKENANKALYDAVLEKDALEEQNEIFSEQIEEDEYRIQVLDAQVKEWGNRWADLERGLGWRVLQKFRSLRLLIAPRKSTREQLFHFVVRKKAENWVSGAAQSEERLDSPPRPSFVPVYDVASAKVARPFVGFEIGFGTKFQEWDRKFSSSLPIVVVPVFNAYPDVVECIESLLSTTPEQIPILILDDASTDRRIRSKFEQLASPRLFYLRKESNTGFVNTINVAFHLSSLRDVVVVNSDVIVPSKWLERLQEAAYSRWNGATATPFTNHGTILSIPHRNTPMDDLGGHALEDVDNRVRSSSLKLRPTIPTAVGHCTYFRRMVIDAIGSFDEIFSPGYGEEVDFSQRAIVAGFLHVVADDLFVYHKGSRSFGIVGDRGRDQLRNAHTQIVENRYPWYREWVAEVGTNNQSSLARAIQAAQSAFPRVDEGLGLTKHVAGSFE